MARAKVSTSARVGKRHRYYAANAVVNCLADGPDQVTCARTVVPFAGGSFSVCVGADGVDVPIPSFPAGFIHACDTQNFVCSVACVVYW